MVVGEITIIADVCAIYLEAKINKKEKICKDKTFDTYFSAVRN